MTVVSASCHNKGLSDHLQREMVGIAPDTRPSQRQIPSPAWGSTTLTRNTGNCLLRTQNPGPSRLLGWQQRFHRAMDFHIIFHLRTVMSRYWGLNLGFPACWAMFEISFLKASTAPLPYRTRLFQIQFLLAKQACGNCHPSLSRHRLHPKLC